MAIILRSGTARENVVLLATRLLARYEGLPGLARASFGALTAALELGSGWPPPGRRNGSSSLRREMWRTCSSRRWGC